MVPLIVLAVGFLLVYAFTRNWRLAARIAFALMLMLTAAAHFVPSQRADLIRMVPPLFPFPGVIVTLTGILEILGLIGLLHPRTARPAAIALAVLLIAMFPANVYAAMHQLTLMGKPATALIPRTLIQLVFLIVLALIARRAEPRTASQPAATG
jgi:uncharacterized membrane protein